MGIPTKAARTIASRHIRLGERIFRPSFAAVSEKSGDERLRVVSVLPTMHLWANGPGINGRVSQNDRAP